MTCVERKVIVRDSDLLNNRPLTASPDPGRALTYMEYLMRFEGVTNPAQVIREWDSTAIDERHFLIRESIESLPTERRESPGLVHHVLSYWADLLWGIGR